MRKKHWFILLTSLAGIFFGVLAGFFLNLIHDLPQINQLKQYKPSAVTTVYSADRQVISRFYTEKRFPVSIEQIPQHLITALVTIEDRNFYSHSGINLKAIIRAAVRDVQAGRFKEGASTLTQQLAKTLFLTNEKSFVRKIKEMILGFQIERRYTKNEILELYLNQIYLGSGTYGVEAAARTYFGKPVKDLTLDQSALIAGLPKAPSVYSPFKNLQLAKKRRDIVLYQMFVTNAITKAAYEKAKAAPVSLYEKKDINQDAGYYIAYIKAVIKQKFDLNQIYSKGLNIQTTLRLDIQKKANNAVQKGMRQLSQRMEKSGLDSAKLQCAVVALDIETGGIVSMVGGRNFSQSPYNRAVQAKRQPGSAFKPFVYAAAVGMGMNQNTVLLDAPLSFRMSKDKTWHVQNFSKTYSGQMTFRKALALSKNTPVVRLMERIGPEKVIAFARTAGIESALNRNLSLALGTSEVNLLELTAAYIPFANMGIKVEPHPIIKITDANGRVLYTHSVEKKSIISRSHAAVITDMLKAVVREGTGRKAAFIKKDIAGKTGTTDNYKDALFVGFCPDLALGVWVGNDDAASLGKNETGARAALPIWIDIMAYHLSRRKTQYFDLPDGIKMVYMNPDNGTLSRKKKTGFVKALIREKDS